jgi:hypothetical protein
MGCKACDKPKPNYRKGLWSPEEDQKLRDYILLHGHGCWSALPAKAGKTDDSPPLRASAFLSSVGGAEFRCFGCIASGIQNPISANCQLLRSERREQSRVVT